MAKTAATALDKWLTNTANAASKALVDGIDGVTESPMDKAADNLNTAAANYQARVADGSMAAALRSTSLSYWKQQFKTKGVPRVQSGVQGAREKMAKFLNEFVPAMVQAGKDAKRLPNRNEQEGLERVRAVNRVARQFKGRVR